MSDYVRYKGKLSLVESKGSLQDTARHCLMVEDKLLCETEDAADILQDLCYKKYVVVGEDIYKMTSTELPYEDSFFDATRNEDGTISFQVQYYNGGCCLSEAVEEAIKEMGS